MILTMLAIILSTTSRLPVVTIGKFFFSFFGGRKKGKLMKVQKSNDDNTAMCIIPVKKSYLSSYSRWVPRLFVGPTKPNQEFRPMS